MGELKIKRVYEAAEDTDGERVLVDRLWPRGIKKGNAALAAWWKDIAPSSELRKWFGHDAEKFGEFAKKYVTELDASEAAKAHRDECASMLERGDVTILFGAKDTEHNNAVVLVDWLKKG